MNENVEAIKKSIEKWEKIITELRTDPDKGICAMISRKCGLCYLYWYEGCSKCLLSPKYCSAVSTENLYSRILMAVKNGKYTYALLLSYQLLKELKRLLAVQEMAGNKS